MILRSFVVVAFVCLVAGAFFWSRASRPQGRYGTAVAAGDGGAGASGERGGMQDGKAWQEIDRLIAEQKLAAAEPLVDQQLAAAKAAKDDAAWTKALVRAVQIRLGRGGFETAVRFLKDQPWPESTLARVTCDLFYAQTLVAYLDAYGYEIRQREAVESSAPLDLKAWTADQIYLEALKAYQDAWTHREELGGEPVTRLADYLEPNNYPEGIRGTLRDAVTYLGVALLANQAYWRPEAVSDLYRLDFAALLEGAPVDEDLSLADPGKPPLIRALAALGDLEAWHAGEGQDEAAFEARLERLRRLAAAFPAAEQRDAIRAHLEGLLSGMRRRPWWAMGVAELARLDRDAGRLVKAHDIARQGADAFPDSAGGQRCRSLQQALAAPDFQLTGMASDAPGKRSLEVRHKNLKTLYFRAYAFDLEQHVEGSRDYNLLPDASDYQRLGSRAPDAVWQVDLPATPDFAVHRTFVTPPMQRSGLYFVVASARPDFQEDRNQVSGVSIVLGDLVLLSRVEAGALVVTALAGQTGRPVHGATVSLYRFDYGKGHHVQEKAVTDKAGTVRFVAKAASSSAYFLIARQGEQVAIDPEYLNFGREAAPKERQASFLYTDRAAYRPGQTLKWKVIAYHGHQERGDLRVAAGADVTLSLVDGNGQTVATRHVQTNAFGSAAGQFNLPTGRLLGQWQLRSSYGGSASWIRVEEYKRPTFELSFDDGDAVPLRINRQVTLRGKATYNFGLPVARGIVAWRVTREPCLPSRWPLLRFGDAPADGNATQVIAAGRSPLDAQGGYTVSFLPTADEAAKDVTYRYVVSADLTDEGGETRSTSRTLRLGRIAVTAAVELEGDAGFLSAGAPHPVTIRRTDLSGAPRPGKGEWRLVSLAQPAATATPADLPVPPEALPKPDPDAPVVTAGDKLRPRWSPGYTADAELARWADGAETARGELAHDPQGLATLTLPPLPPGPYRLRYATVDDFGARYELTKDLIVAGPKLALALPAVLVIERPAVAAGGTARLLVHSGLAGQTLVLDLARAGGRHERRFLESGGPSVIDVPVGAADRGGIGVTLSVVTDHQAMVLHRTIRVPWTDRQLDVSFTSFRDRLQPGGKETWTLHVKGAGAAQAAAEVLTFMYDRSLDLYAKTEVPSPLDAFPSLTDATWLHVSLGSAHGQVLAGRGFEERSPTPVLTGDRLRFLDGTVIGGPGRRHGLLRAGGRAFTLSLADGNAERLPGAAPMASAAPTAGAAEAAKSADAMPAGLGPPAAPAAAASDVRSDFAETAFFQPQLVTDAHGDVSVTFTVPDSLTAWSVWAVATTRDLASGVLHREARSLKELMVRPYLPRFLREGDGARLPVVINNAAARELAGELTLEVLDPATGESLTQAFGVTAPRRSFKVAAAGGSATVTFDLKAPARLGAVAIRVTAAAGELSDGELRPLPVLPSRLHLAQSRTVALHGEEPRTLAFAGLAADDDPTRTSEALTVRVDGDLLGSVMAALPYLVSYPYDCVEQMLNRYLAAGLARRIIDADPGLAKLARQLAKRPTRLEAWSKDDPTRRMALEEAPWLQEAQGGAKPGPGAAIANLLDARVAAAERDAALTRLLQAQTAAGGFPWFPGGPPSPYMTLYLMHGFARAAEAGLTVPKDAVTRGWSYLGKHFRDEIRPGLGKAEARWEFPTFLNYVASAYPDSSWTGQALTADDRRQLLELSMAHWRDMSPLLKSYLALTLKRAGRSQDAKLVFDSVLDTAKTERDIGTFWAPEDRSWLWYNDTVESHAFALRTLLEIEPKAPKKDGLALWLFLDKRLNHWRSTKATAEAALALVKYLEGERQLGGRQAATVAVGGATQVFHFDPARDGGRAELALSGPAVTKAAATVTVTPRTKGMMLATATWQFATDRLPAAASGDFFTVTRRYFRRGRGQAATAGPETVLQPLVDGEALAPGDEIEVQLALTARHEAEYVHLRDPRGAGFEPSSLTSRWRVDTGLGYYEQVRDSGEDFFFERLPVGEYTFRYRIRASTAGTFRVGPAVVQPLYAPEFVAYSAGATLVVK